MAGENAYGLENVERVWARVTGETPPARDESAALRSFMEDEARDGAVYAALSRRAARAAQTLSRMAADERRHLWELQVEYFLLTGDSYVPAPSCPAPGETLSALRRAREGEIAGAAAYRTAAAAAEDKTLRDLYEQHAGDEETHAAELRELISRAMAF